MARVNLRNRLRENSGEEPDSNKVSGIQSHITEINSEIMDSPELLSNQQQETIPVNPRLNVPEKVEKQREAVSPPAIFDNEEPLAPTQKQQLNTRINNRVVTPPKNLKRHEEVLFKDEDDSDEKELKTLFGTKKLFSKKDEKVKSGNNILDRLNINKKMLYFALGLAAVASLLVINFLYSFREKELYGSELIPVLVANKEIKEKSVITLADLAQKQIPKKFVLDTSIKLDGKIDPKTLVGKIALTDIYEGEQITLKRVVSQEDSPWLSPAVPLNHRAFSITTRSLSYIKREILTHY